MESTLKRPGFPRTLKQTQYRNAHFALFRGTPASFPIHPFRGPAEVTVLWLPRMLLHHIQKRPRPVWEEGV